MCKIARRKRAKHKPVVDLSIISLHSAASSCVRASAFSAKNLAKLKIWSEGWSSAPDHDPNVKVVRLSSDDGV